LWHGFFIAWCGFWAAQDGDIALHQFGTMMSSGSPGSILLATWDVIVVVAFLITLRQNCVWYARARRRNR
jgi:hypothetical protein